MSERDGFASDLRTYLVGFGLAVALSAVPFAMVATHRPRAQVLWVLLGCGLVQVLVHFAASCTSTCPARSATTCS